MDLFCFRDFVIQNDYTEVIFYTEEDSRAIFRLMSSVFVLSTIFLPNANITNALSLLVTAAMKNQARQNIFVSCRTECLTELFSTAHLNDMFGKRFTWILLTDNEIPFEEILPLTRLEEYLSPNSQVYTLTSRKATMLSVPLCYVARIAHLRVNENNTITTLPYYYLSTRRRHHNFLPLQGYTLKVGIFHIPPILTVVSRHPETVCRGYTAELMQELGKYLGFSYKFIEEETSTFGNFINGTWTGVVGKVQRKEFDVGGFTFGLLPARMEIVDYSAPILLNSQAAVIKRPTTDNKECDFFVYVDPMSLPVWFACGGVCLVVFICGVITVKIYVCCKGSQDDPQEYRITSWAWTLLAALLQTDAAEMPKKQSTYVLFFTFSVFLILSFKTYLSLLTATLTVQHDQPLYDNLDELIDDGIYGIAVLRQAADSQVLRSAKSGPLKRIWDKVQSNTPKSEAATIDQGFELVMKEKYVFFAARVNIAIPRVIESNCALEILKQRYIEMILCFIHPKMSPFVEFFSLKLLSMRSSGVLQKLQKIYYAVYDPSKCKSAPFMTIPVHQIVGALSALGLGILAALLCLVLEIGIGKLYD